MFFCYLRPCCRNLWTWGWPFHTGFLHRPAQAKQIIFRWTTTQWELHIAARILSVQYCVNHTSVGFKNNLVGCIYRYIWHGPHGRSCFILCRGPTGPLFCACCKAIAPDFIPNSVHPGVGTCTSKFVEQTSRPHVLTCNQMLMILELIWLQLSWRHSGAEIAKKLRQNLTDPAWDPQICGTPNFAAKLKSSVCRMQVFSCVLQFFAVGVPDLSGLMKHDLTILQFRFGGSEMQSDGVAVPCRSQTGVRNLFCSFVYLSAALIVRIGLTLFYALLNRRHPTRFWFISQKMVLLVGRQRNRSGTDLHRNIPKQWKLFLAHCSMMFNDSFDLDDTGDLRLAPSEKRQARDVWDSTMIFFLTTEKRRNPQDSKLLSCQAIWCDLFFFSRFQVAQTRARCNGFLVILGRDGGAPGVRNLSRERISVRGAFYWLPCI